jgi:2-polyprenyl-6-methoxyphenol hydroxylase-like FAD-dependent oxidoreductase
VYLAAMRPARTGDVIVVGGGLVGLCSSLLLARDGHRVRLLERDPAAPPPPDVDPWDRWERRGVNQFQLLHGFLPMFRQLLDAELPDVNPALEAAGAYRFNRLRGLPDELTGGWRPGDERFESVTGRRPMVEAALARLVDQQPGVEVLRGVGVRGLLTGTPRHSGIPHVTGVATEGGDELHGDLVVDASGRRTRIPELLEAIGARVPPAEREDTGLVYYGRHFRSSDGTVPEVFGPPVQHHESITTVTLPADRGTWGVALVATGQDTVARAARDPDVWTRVVKSYPLIAHWLEGEPITGIDVMAAIHDARRDFWRDGVPVATGIVPVGDAWACSNPSLGRGASIGLRHAIALRDVVREVGTRSAVELVRRWHEETRATVEPLYRDCLDFSRHRAREIEAQVAGRAYEPSDPGWQVGKRLAARATGDPDLFRAAMSIAALVARPVEVLSDPTVQAKLETVQPAAPLPGLTRAELVGVLTS